MSEIIELSTFTLKPPLPSPPPTLLSALQTLAAAPGLVALYFGSHIESPTTYTSVARWSSQASRAAFVNSPSFAAWKDSFSSDIDSLAVLASSSPLGSDAAVPLEAPCTEIFSSFGADEDYLETRLNPFKEAITGASLPGLVGGVTAEFVPVRHVGVEPPESKTVVLMLGWNSKADHEAQRGEGKVIDNNIHLVRSGRKSVSLFHVNFKKL